MDPRVQKILALMGSNLHKKISLDKMAHSVNLSHWHLHRLFKAATGVTPARYLKRLRMQRASRLLETTFLSVKEIMLKIGLHDESHFIRDFKRAYGMTPIHYRARFLAGESAQAGQSSRAAKSANK